MNTREQGDCGEFAAMRWLRNQGAIVFQPFGHSPDIDLVAVFDADAVRIQVKTSCSSSSVMGGSCTSRRSPSRATPG